MKFLNKIGVQYLWNAITAKTGDLAALTTTAKTDLVAALNEVKAGVESAGEPFRLKKWASDLNMEIPHCSEDVSNGEITKMTYKIEGQEAVDFMVAGMIAYEVFDGGGSRINCWPVCQFTGQNTTELSVRWMCGGTTRKTATRVSAWVLLKHR